MMIPAKMIVLRFVIVIKGLVLALAPFIYKTQDKVSLAFFARLFLAIYAVGCTGFLIFLNRNLRYNTLKLVINNKGLFFECLLNFILFYFLLFGSRLSSNKIGEYYSIRSTKCSISSESFPAFHVSFHLSLIFLFQITVLNRQTVIIILTIQKIIEFVEALKQNIQIITQEEELFQRQSKASSSAEKKLKKNKKKVAAETDRSISANVEKPNEKLSKTGENENEKSVKGPDRKEEVKKVEEEKKKEENKKVNVVKTGEKLKKKEVDKDLLKKLKKNNDEILVQDMEGSGIIIESCNESSEEDSGSEGSSSSEEESGSSEEESGSSEKSEESNSSESSDSSSSQEIST